MDCCFNPNIKILRIDSSARGDGSETRALRDALIGHIEATANTTVTHRDLAVDTPNFVNKAWVGANFTDPDGALPHRQKSREGENIGCPEVEAVISNHPRVSECAVFGLPDERLCETVAAAVMVASTELLTVGNIQSHVGEHLARFKVPEHVWISKDHLPRTASGKIFKRVLRDGALEKMKVDRAVRAG